MTALSSEAEATESDTVLFWQPLVVSNDGKILRHIRRTVTNELAKAGFADTAPAVTQIITEYAANVRNHTKSLFAIIKVYVADGWIVVTVVDHGDAKEPGTVPTCRTGDPDEEGGRGLLLVDALCSKWGWTPNAGGMGISRWARIEVPE